MSFFEDLKFGNLYEKRFIKDLKLTDYELAPKKIFKDWDIKTNSATYEIKTDRYTNKTNNFCIEISCNNKPSGLTTTKSDYYGYYEITNEEPNLYLIPTKDIKELIKNNNFTKKRVGENYKSECFLIPKKYFLSYLYTNDI
jgi:hypothetical protein